MPRAGLATIIRRLRELTSAGTADYALAGTTYWTDDQLQAELDAHRMDFVREGLRAETEFVAGAEETHNYYTTRRNLEEAASGTAAWVVEDATGAAVGTANYTVNYEAGQVRFTADTDGTAYYLSGRSFDVNKAAASVWEKKAAHAWDAYDFAADGASFKRSQMHDHCLKMAAQFRSLAVGIKVSRLFRSDAA
jgi:hypothetical protein